jgi:hypothetical protein
MKATTKLSGGKNALAPAWSLPLATPLWLPLGTAPRRMRNEEFVTEGLGWAWGEKLPVSWQERHCRINAPISI